MKTQHVHHFFITQTIKKYIYLYFFPPSLSVLAYVLQVKVEMELEIQQCEKTKAMREEQLERLTQICQEQAVSTFHPPGWFTPSWQRNDEV